MAAAVAIGEVASDIDGIVSRTEDSEANMIFKLISIVELSKLSEVHFHDNDVAAKLSSASP